MTDGHRHYQQLAVGHVLGGLAAEDAADFRSHLAGCRDCRARVAELRGIASDLERAERDERARTLVRTQTPRRSEPEEASAGAPSSGGRIGVRHVTVAVIVVAVLAAGIAFWNLHLRTTTAVATAIAEQQARALEVLASGVTVEVEAEHPVRGIAATDGEHVALVLAGVDPPGDGVRPVAWLRDTDGQSPVAEMRPGQLDDGVVELFLEVEDAEELELTLERGELGERPQGSVLARVGLRASGRAPASP